MKRLFIFLFFSVFSYSVSGINIHGIVFVDLNGNGIRDKNEVGLKGIAVSDQVSVVLTDANGFYTLTESKGNGYVFISMPQGYKAVKSFYNKLASNSSNIQSDFALVKSTNPTTFKFIHASDTHISETNLARMQKFMTVVDSIRPDFVLVTGDLVKDALRVSEKDALALYNLYKTEISKFTTPVWNVPGNHEIFGIERELSKVSKDNPFYGRKMYREYFGPDYYSFNFGGIHFVALNALDFEDMWYYGYIDDTQKEWLKKDLAAIPATMPVVTFQHVPFISGELSLTGFTETGPGRTLENEKGKPQFRHVVSNAQEIFKILRTHPFPLALGGHHHSRQLYFIETNGQQTRFEQAAAVVGPVEGEVLQMPSGVTLYEVENGEIFESIFIKMK